MNTTKRWLSLALALGLVCQSGVAGTILGTNGQKCYPRTYSTSLKSTIAVYGDWIETIGQATTTAGGVNVSIVDKKNGLQNNTEPFKGRGMVTLKITTNNASPGDKNIKLSGGVFGEATLTITVAASPTVTDVSVPTPADPFDNIVVTLTGTGLQQALDPASGAIIADNLTPLITVGGDVRVNSVRVLNSSNTSLQARVFFSGLVQDATVELSFRTSSACVPLINGLKHRVRVKSTNIKNYVSAITFPNGNTITQNSIATIHIKLLFPAPGGSTRTVSFTAGGRTYTTQLPDFANTLDNSRVFFKLVPANAFEGVPGGTPYSQVGFNEVRANAGEDIIPITVKVIDCLGGLPGATNVVKIQTWMHTTNSSLPPNFVEKTFQVRCP